MSSLLHAKSVQTHLEHFIDETLDLDLVSLFQELQKAHQELKTALDHVETWAERKEDGLKAMKSIDKKLLTYLGHSTMEMAFVLPELDYAVLLTGRNLSVSTRLRYRLRMLQKLQEKVPAAQSFCDSHAEILREYDEKADAYLRAVALLSHFQQTALWQSQQIRPLLCRAKLTLLKSCQEGSAQYKRIKKRVVRTRKALWLQGEDASYGPARV